LSVAYGLISVLADPGNIDVSELRANSLLMSTRPLFRPVAPGDEVKVALASSAILLVTAMTGAMALGISAGLLYSGRRPGKAKALIWAVATLCAALPPFFWAVALELAMIVVWSRLGIRLLPTAGYGIDDHLVLPALALGLRPTAYIFRLTAIAVQDISGTEYVRTAVAKGLDARQVLTRHVLPNAMPNIIAASVLATRGALSSLVIIEFVYVWGGAGLAFVQALGHRRLDLAIELGLAFAIGSCVLSLIADFARSRVQVHA